MRDGTRDRGHMRRLLTSVTQSVSSSISEGRNAINPPPLVGPLASLHSFRRTNISPFLPLLPLSPAPLAPSSLRGRRSSSSRTRRQLLAKKRQTQRTQLYAKKRSLLLRRSRGGRGKEGHQRRVAASRSADPQVMIESQTTKIGSPSSLSLSHSVFRFRYF